MNLVQKLLSALGGIFLAALLIAALAPKATRGVAAALVQVVNSKSSPVNVADTAPNQVFQSVCTSSVTIASVANECSIPVPAGKRLVVQTVSVQTTVDPGVRVAIAGFSTLIGGAEIPIILDIPFTGSTTGGRDVSERSQELRFYHDGGNPTGCEVDYTAVTSNSSLTCSIAGYLADIP